jgi:hypothetical protein
MPDPRRGGWTLGTAWFATLGEAEREARREALVRHAPIFLHDRYHRVRALEAR